MKKLIVLGGGAVIAASASMALFGVGVAAAAPDVVGMTYEEAESEIEDAGDTVKIAVRVGGKLPQEECIVTDAHDAPFMRVDGFSEGEVMLALNCNGGYASVANPGASVASPAGREAKLAAEEAAEAEEQELAEAATPGA